MRASRISSIEIPPNQPDSSVACRDPTRRVCPPIRHSRVGAPGPPVLCTRGSFETPTMQHQQRTGLRGAYSAQHHQPFDAYASRAIFRAWPRDRTTFMLAKLADEVARTDLVPIILEGRASSRDIYNESSAQLQATVDAAHAGSHKSGERPFHAVPLDPAAQCMSLSN